MVNTSNNFGNSSLFDNALFSGFIHITYKKPYFKS
jgi:hypothetical protein